MMDRGRTSAVDPSLLDNLNVFAPFHRHNTASTEASASTTPPRDEDDGDRRLSVTEHDVVDTGKVQEAAGPESYP